MSKQKQPYIPFYTGDYIKDTRKLPLAARGAWVDLLLFMWNEEVKGEIIASREEFAGMLSCSLDEVNFALDLLMQKKICAYEILPQNKIKIISRRMKRDIDISKKRSESGKKGFFAKNLLQQNKEFASAKIKQNTEYDNEYDNEYKEDRGVGKGVVVDMVRVFKNSFPEYPIDESSDYAACLQIAYKIAKANNWEKSSVVNGKAPDVVKEWEAIVLFARSDNWFCTRSIFDLNKEYQRLIQSMINKKNGQTIRGNSEKGNANQGDVPEGGFGPL